MVDQEMYDIHHPECWTPSHSCDLDGEEMKGDSRTTLTDEEYLMFPALVYGYSLSDREWCMSPSVLDLTSRLTFI